MPIAACMTLSATYAPIAATILVRQNQENRVIVATPAATAYIAANASNRFEHHQLR